MDNKFVIQEGIELVKKTAFCHNSEPKIYKKWTKDVPNLGQVHFISFLVTHDKLGKVLKTVGLCYKLLTNCMLDELVEVLKTKKFDDYDKLYETCEEVKKYSVLCDSLYYHQLSKKYHLRFDEVKSLPQDEQFNKDKIEKIIIENLVRKRNQFIKDSTIPLITCINETLIDGISTKEIVKIMNALKEYPKNDNEDDSVCIGIIPPGTKLRGMKYEIITSKNVIPFNKDPEPKEIGYDIETSGLDDIFEIKTNIYR